MITSLNFQGITTGSKQAAFMDNLIDLVCIMDTAEDPQNKALRSPGVVRLINQKIVKYIK